MGDYRYSFKEAVVGRHNSLARSLALVRQIPYKSVINLDECRDMELLSKIVPVLREASVRGGDTVGAIKAALDKKGYRSELVGQDSGRENGFGRVKLSVIVNGETFVGTSEGFRLAFACHYIMADKAQKK